MQVLYALTAGVAGYVAAVSYKVMGGTNWVRNVLLTTALFCGPMLATFSFLNTVAIVYRSTAALPFGTICIILVIWALITFPLTVLGGIAGKNSKVPKLGLLTVGVNSSPSNQAPQNKHNACTASFLCESESCEVCKRLLCKHLSKGPPYTFRTIIFCVSRILMWGMRGSTGGV